MGILLCFVFYHVIGNLPRYLDCTVQKLQSKVGRQFFSRFRGLPLIVGDPTPKLPATILS